MESPWKMLWLSLYLSLYFSTFGLLFSLGLSWAYALARKAEGSAWMIQAEHNQPERKVRFLLVAVLGGVGGDFAAVNSLFLSEWLRCRTPHFSCYDGQGGIVLVVTVPLFAIVGVLVAWGWTWLSLRIPPHQPWASVFRYGGRLRWVNWLLALVTPLAFWALVTLGLIWTTL